jgi:hypothetical protein
MNPDDKKKQTDNFRTYCDYLIAIENSTRLSFGTGEWFAKIARAAKLMEETLRNYTTEPTEAMPGRKASLCLVEVRRIFNDPENIEAPPQTNAPEEIIAISKCYRCKRPMRPVVLSFPSARSIAEQIRICDQCANEAVKKLKGTVE